MPLTIQCLKCGVTLSVPDQAAGRRLKCPRCAAKFLVGEGGVIADLSTGPRGPGGGAGLGPDTTFELPRKSSSTELPVMPTAAGDLRETFDLEAMTGAATPEASPSRRSAPADALVLFTDDAPVTPRRKKGAEGRAQARRCPTCGGVVPVGMSLCQTCGLDLDTGTRIDLDEDLAPPPPPRSQGLPIVLSILGGLCLAMSVALGIAAGILWTQGHNGLQYFIPVAAFGVYASVQFLREKSVKLLLIALTLGALVDVVGMIGMPIFAAVNDAPTIQRTGPSDDPDAPIEDLRPVTERIDTQRIGTGVALLSLYAVTSIYLLSASVQKHFRR